MAKGAFYPELFQLQLYMEDFKEAESFLRDYYDDLIRPAAEASENGLPLPPIRFHSEKYSLDQIIAVGSFIHEYVHYLQYTTRNLGLLFYESRYQQFLWTSHCINELNIQGYPIQLPLMRWFEKGKNIPAPLQKWRSEWGAYQGAISLSGMGPVIGWDEPFGSYFRSEFEPNWLPILEFQDENGEVESVEISTSVLMETEADIITISLLEALFPDRYKEACDELIGQSISIQRSIAFPMMYHGLTHLIPIIADYSMQLTFDASGTIKSSTAMFCDMLEIVRSRYAGISLDDVIRYNQEIVKEISTRLHVKPLEDAVKWSVNRTEHTNMYKTGLGQMLISTMQFRAKHRLMFLAPVAFILQIITALPEVVWVCYNSGILGNDASCVETFHGKLIPDKKHFDVIFLRELLWATRELALRKGQYICPQCQINARWEKCSGQCGFVAQCRKQFGIDIYETNWQL